MAAGWHGEAPSVKLVLGSHREVVCAVVRVDSDFGLGTRAWADRAGLRFLGLGVEPYGLVALAQTLGEPALLRLCEIPGYDAAGAGTVVFDLVSTEGALA